MKYCFKRYIGTVICFCSTVSLPWNITGVCDYTEGSDSIGVNFRESCSSALKNGDNSSFRAIEGLFNFGQGLERWNNMAIKLIKAPLSSHSLVVGSLSYVFVSMHNYLTGEKLNPERAALLGFWHDAEETYTGDIISPTKHATNKMKNYCKSIEEKAVKDFVGMVSKPIRDEIYMALTMTKPGDDKLSPYVKFADGMSAYLECVFELNLGNRTFLSPALRIYDELCSLANKNPSMPAMRYYLDIVPVISKEGVPFLKNLKVNPERYKRKSHKRRVGAHF